MNIEIFSKLKDRLHKIEEGYRKFPYLDTEGNLTVGIGMNLDSGEFSKQDIARYKREGCSLEEALEYLTNKLYQLDVQLSKNITYNILDDIRKSILVNMAYNMGITKLMKFYEMWKALKIKDFISASKEMLWNKDGTKTPYYRKVKGRAKRLSEMMKTGVWYE